jgi:hypothetical protein
MHEYSNSKRHRAFAFEAQYVCGIIKPLERSAGVGSGICQEFRGAISGILANSATDT